MMYWTGSPLQSLSSRPETVLAEYGEDRPGFSLRIQFFEGGYAFLQELRQQHQVFSMTFVRNAVMSIPAARTILGTREALVMPGMVLISKK